MKRKVNIAKTLVLAAGVVLALAYFLAGSTTGSSMGGVRASSLHGPRDTYAAHCAECHGANGKAKTAKGRSMGATDFTSDWNTDQARGIRIITNGKSEMPSFKGKLSAGAIRSVFGYISRFRR